MKKKKNIIKNNIIDNQYTSNIIFICKNCDYTEKIRQTFRLYQSDNNLKNKIKDNTPEINSFYLEDPTLPRSNNYVCKNIDCISLKEKEKEKNHIVFYRNPDNSITSVCSSCKFSWVN